MNPPHEERGQRLNTRTFAIREGDRIYVVVPVLVYEPGDSQQSEGFAAMNRMFTSNAVAPFQALEIEGTWCTLDPHNSKARSAHQADPLVGGDHDDPDDDDD